MASPVRRRLKFGEDDLAPCSKGCCSPLDEPSMRICSSSASDKESEECCHEDGDTTAATAADGAHSADVMESFRQLLSVLAGKHALETGDAALNLACTPKSFRDDLHVVKKQWQLLTADKENMPQPLTKSDSDRLTRIRNCTRALFNLTHALPPLLCVPPLPCLKLRAPNCVLRPPASSQ